MRPARARRPASRSAPWRPRRSWSPPRPRRWSARARRLRARPRGGRGARDGAADRRQARHRGVSPARGRGAGEARGGDRRPAGWREPGVTSVHIEATINGEPVEVSLRRPRDPAGGAARPARADGDEGRLRDRRLRRLFGAARRPSRARVPRARTRGDGPPCHDDRGHRGAARPCTRCSSSSSSRRRCSAASARRA